MLDTSSNTKFFSSELLGYVMKSVRDKAAAQDIVQDVFIKVQSKISQLKESEKITGWIYQITRNAIADYFRQKSKVVHADDLDWSSDRALLNECVGHCLSEMMKTLPEKYRQALELTEFENLSQTELAQRLGISYSGAKSRVQRAKQMLKFRMDLNFYIKTDNYGNVVVCENKVPCTCAERFSDSCE